MINIDEIGDKEVRALKSFILHVFRLLFDSWQETGGVVILVGVNRLVPMHTLALSRDSAGILALLLVHGDLGHLLDLCPEISWTDGSQELIVLALDFVFSFGLLCKVVSDIKENIFSN